MTNLELIFEESDQVEVGTPEFSWEERSNLTGLVGIAGIRITDVMGARDAGITDVMGARDTGITDVMGARYLE